MAEWHTLSDDDKYDNLVDRLTQLGLDSPGLPADVLCVLTKSWDTMRWHRRQLLSVINEVTAMMERED